MGTFAFLGKSSHGVLARLYRSGLLLVEFGVERVVVFAVQIFLGDAQSFAEAGSINAIRQKFHKTSTLL